MNLFNKIELVNEINLIDKIRQNGQIWPKQLN